MKWITLVLAVWGAMVSTVLALLHLVQLIQKARERRERAEGRIAVRVHDEVEQQSFDESVPLICFTAVNEGERPVTLEKLLLDIDGVDGLVTLYGEPFGGSPGLPVALAHGEYVRFFCWRNEFVERLRIDEVPESLRFRAVYIDESGREHRSGPYLFGCKQGRKPLGTG